MLGVVTQDGSEEVCDCVVSCLSDILCDIACDLCCDVFCSLCGCPFGGCCATCVWLTFWQIIVISVNVAGKSLHLNQSAYSLGRACWFGSINPRKPHSTFLPGGNDCCSLFVCRSLPLSTSVL